MHASSRFLFGQFSNPAPSRFLKELNDKNIEKINVFGGTKTYNNYNKSTYNKDDGFQKYNKKKAAENTTSEYSFDKVSKQTKINSNQLSKRVFHERFGMGMVIKKQGENLDILFDNGSRKKIKEKFVKEI